MTLLPPDLGFDWKKYYRDLEYRNECEQEIAAERVVSPLLAVIKLL